jgi:hypothetical protein
MKLYNFLQQLLMVLSVLNLLVCTAILFLFVTYPGGPVTLLKDLLLALH